MGGQEKAGEELRKIFEAMEFISPDDIPGIDLYMDQVTKFMDERLETMKRRGDDKLLTKTMINNYVKAGLIDKPTGKKYSREALAQLLMISLMKVSTPLDVMNKILHPESGTETKEMYSSFVATQRRVKNEIIAKGNIPALDYALESASLQLALRLLMD